MTASVLTVKGGIMEDPCTLMIQDFFKKQRKDG